MRHIPSFFIGIVMVGAVFCSCQEVGMGPPVPFLSAERQELESPSSGGTVHYAVRIDQTSDPVQAFGLDLAFDPSQVRYTGTWDRGELTKGFTTVGLNEVKKGQIRIGGFTGTDPIPEASSGNLAVLEFEVLSSAPSSLSIVSRVDDLKDMQVSPE